jgi:hypothetical protein
MPFKYDPEARAYWDEETGAYVSQSQMADIRDDIVDANSEKALALTAAYIAQEITLDDWSRGMGDLIERVTEQQYMLGRGGMNRMSPEDWAAVDRQVANQSAFLGRFRDDLRSGILSPEKAYDRTRLYMEATRSAYEQALAKAWTGMNMPSYPGDGRSGCKTRCRCRWDYREVDGRIHATWKLEPGADHCPECSANALRYNPLVL